jgi:formylglycine-generating enzyme
LKSTPKLLTVAGVGIYIKQKLSLSFIAYATLYYEAVFSVLVFLLINRKILSRAVQAFHSLRSCTHADLMYYFRPSYGIFKIHNTHSYIPKGKTMKLKNLSVIFILAAMAAYSIAAHAVTINLVPVGNAGNAADDTGYGAVSYNYSIGKYEITAGQYTEFLNAVAATDTYGLFSEVMDYNAYPNYYGCNIQRTGTSGSYRYSVEEVWANRPVNYISWGDAARFCNWLSNGQPRGNQDLATTEDGSYYLNGATSDGALWSVTRKNNAVWVIPSEDEWYKAAYHKNDGVTGSYWDYPTKTDNMPNNGNPEGFPVNNMANFYDGDFTIGSPYYRTPVGMFGNSSSPYGTLDQAGNVWEWNEATFSDWFRGLRGGAWDGGSNGGMVATGQWSGRPTGSNEMSAGFRVVFVPEPCSITLLVCGVIAGLLWRRRRRKKPLS